MKKPFLAKEQILCKLVIDLSSTLALSLTGCVPLGVLFVWASLCWSVKWAVSRSRAIPSVVHSLLPIGELLLVSDEESREAESMH